MTELDAGTQFLEALGVPMDEQDAAESLPDFAAPEPLPAAPIAAPLHITLQRMVLLAMVEQAMLVVPTKSHYPPLQNLVLDVTEGRLAITGSNSTSTVISHTSTLRVERPGRVLISAAKFSSVVRRAAGSEITLQVEDRALHIVSGSYAVSLRCDGSQEYPPLPALGDLTWHTVNRHAFDRAVSGSRYSAGTDEAKDEFLQLDIAAGVATATDRHRFAQVTAELPPELACAIPVQGVDLLVRMLERNDSGHFRLAHTEFHVVADIGPIEAPDRLIVTKIMSPFPPDARTAVAIPLAQNRDVLTVEGAALIEALRRAVPTSDEETGAVALRISDPEPGQLTVASRNRQRDWSTEQIVCTFARPGTENTPAARVVIVSHEHLTQAIKAALLVSPDEEDTDEVVGPVRLILGESAQRSKPPYVLVTDMGPDAEVGSVLAVLPQLRSEWLS